MLIGHAPILRYPVFHLLVVGQVAALGIEQFDPVADDSPQPFQHGNRGIQIGSHRPGSQHIGLIVGQRTDHGDGSSGSERQQPVLVFQQHETLGRDPASLGAMLRREHIRPDPHRIMVFIGVAEKPQSVFRPEYPAARPIDLLHPDFARIERGFQRAP